MRTMLKRQWFQWTARKEDNSGVVMSGKTPEEAIRKLREKYPEISNSEVIYEVMTKKISKGTKICSVCGKEVLFVKATKPNGRKGIMIIHEGEKMPSDAEEPNVTNDYKKELMKIHHKKSELVADKKPIVDVSGMKRNRFAIIGKIRTTLRENNMSETDIKLVGNTLMAKSTSFQNLVEVALPYVNISENGQVL